MPPAEQRMAQGAPSQAQWPMFRLRELVDGLRSGDLPLLALAARIEDYFSEREPQVLAFVPEAGRFERLRREARALLQRYPEPDERPPLFGVPMGVKDIFHVAGLPTTAGSKLPQVELQGAEASVVTALKQAGALVLGKTVTTEFAYFAPGPTRNPHHAGHTPGGSSSGSAAAVAAGLCPLALGTQTIGSVNRPAAFCGVVGFKPSYERISRDGLVPLSPSLDHVGLFTADVPGMALAASVVLSDWQPAAGGSRPTLGIPTGPYLQRASSEGLANFEAACRALRQAGYTVREVSAMPDFERIETWHTALVAAEAARVHEQWFAKYDHMYHARTAELLTRGAMTPEEAIEAARQGRLMLRRELAALMADNGIDLWIAPAARGAAPAGLESTGDPIMNLPWTYSGLPVLTVPSGAAENGLPLGLQLVGPWRGDESLLQQAGDIATVAAAGGAG